jgi:hypothetical protein
MSFCTPSFHLALGLQLGSFWCMYVYFLGGSYSILPLLMSHLPKVLEFNNGTNVDILV